MTSPTSPQPPPNITIAHPGPWKTRCKMWWIPLSTGGHPLRPDMSDPLETKLWSSIDMGSNASFPGMMQLVRYSDTPVGPYDELVMIPGWFTNPKFKGKYARITRIYVSQRDTCWNGRRWFGIPKHLASFEIRETDSKIEVAVYPSISQEDPTRSEGARPFFSGRLEKIGYLPSLPLNDRLLGWAGYSNLIVQPPLPSGSRGEGGEDGGTVLCGATEWKKTPLQFESLGGARLCWVDVDGAAKGMDATETDGLLQNSNQHGGNASGKRIVDCEGHWEDIKPLAWKIGVWLGETTLDLQETVDLT